MHARGAGGGGGGSSRGGDPWRRGNSRGGSGSTFNHRDPHSQHQSQSQSQSQPQQRGQPPGSSRGRGRTSSAPWSRLKPVELDPLDALGLPSKGDDRLLDFKTQERYYTKIVERYMAFCSDAGQRDELLRRFASLSVNTDATGQSLASSSSTSNEADSLSIDGVGKPKGMAASRHAWDTEGSAPSKPSTPSTAQSSFTPTATPAPGSSLNSEEHAKSLSDVLSALRKLREGIVASKRVDNFSIQAYLFCIRLAILAKHPESYHAAIQHLLTRIHPAHNMTTVETHEVVSYLILDTACRRANLAEAYAVRSKYKFRDSKVDATLDALTHDNYIEFNRLRSHVDGHRARLLEYAEGGMRKHSLKCFGKTYLSVDLGYLEKCTGSKWASLAANDAVGWDLEGDKVVIKRVRAK